MVVEGDGEMIAVAVGKSYKRGMSRHKFLLTRGAVGGA